MAEKFTIGLIQMSCSPDPRENFSKAERRIREAAARGAQIVCLQELFRSQYFCREENPNFFDLAEPIPGPSTTARRPSSYAVSLTTPCGGRASATVC